MRTVYLALALLGIVGTAPALYAGATLWQATGHAAAFLAPILACLALAGFCLHRAECDDER